MKKILKTIPTEKTSLPEHFIMPLTKKENITFNKRNLSIIGSLKENNRFIFQSMFYLSLAYNLNEFNIVLIDFNRENKTLYPLTSLDSISFSFLEPDSISLSVSLDELDKQKRTIFFINNSKNNLEIKDYEILIEDNLKEIISNKNYNVISFFEETQSETKDNFVLSIKGKKDLLEKDFIPDFILKINQEINNSISDVMNYRRSRVSYIGNKRLI